MGAMFEGVAYAYAMYALLVTLFVMGVVAYRGGKLGVFFVSVVALLMWLLSAVMNVWTGYNVGSVMSLYGAIFGGLFMLVTEFIVPVSMVYKRKMNTSLPAVVVVSIIMAIGLSVFSFWNGSAMSMNTHLAEMIKTKEDTDVKKVSLESAETQASRYTITATQSVKPLQNKVERLGNADAHNLKGNTVFKKGVKQTVLAVTNNCTSGYYYTSPKLYKSTCSEINRLRDEISTTLANNKMVTINVSEVVKLNNDKEKLMKEISNNNYSNNTAMPFITLLLDKVSTGKCEINDNLCEKKKEDNIKNVTSTMAFYIAVFAEVTKTALVVLAIGLLVPSKLKPVSIGTYLTRFIVFIFTSPVSFIHWRKNIVEVKETKKAEAYGNRKAELDFEQQRIDDNRRNEVLLLEADSWMKAITFDQVRMVVNIDKMMRGKKVNHEDVLMLLILVCREFEQNKHIPLRATLDSIKNKVENDNDYIKALTGDMKVNYTELVSIVGNVCKPHRLKSIVLPALVDSGLSSMKTDSSGGDQYYWESDDNVEDTFKYALKQQIEQDKGV